MVGFNTPLRHHEPQKLSRCHLECTHTRIEFHVVGAKGVKYFLKVLQMVVLPTAFYQHVVDVDLNIPPDLVREHLLHEPLIRRAYVLKAEQHHFVTEEALASNK